MASQGITVVNKPQLYSTFKEFIGIKDLPFISTTRN
jgi:hypothetical protein